jgi:alpha,alpha-trehalase
MRSWRALILGAWLAATACAAHRPAAPAATPPAASAPAATSETAQLAKLRAYIHDTWPVLTRSLRDLPRAAIDPKANHAPGTPWPVYLPPNTDAAEVDAALRAVLPPDARATIVLRNLPALPAFDVPSGLLYLPHPYVVPGGRFNEMYGWDSAFILIGLLAEPDIPRARDLVDDAIYEVTHYGGVLNANRTFALSRGQPPFLGRMVWTVYGATRDRAWLTRAREAVVAEHAHWTTAPHLVSATGLSRYFDHGEGPAPEVVASERDAAGQTHYDRVRAAFRERARDPAAARAVAPYYDAATDALTPLFFKDDRAMRESGFDPTDRFGPFGAGTTSLVPVCLNTLLYAMELDLAQIDDALERPANAAAWRAQATARRGRMDTLLWDETAGLYFDYDFTRGARRVYPFATTFWPLWAGLATPVQARRVRDNLARFERPGGLVTSTRRSGSQWDAPFGWAPLQYLAVEGLRRAGYRADADRIARAFLTMLVEDFSRRGTLVEKYDVERRTSALDGALQYGYTTNEVGFGWTNAVALSFMREAGNAAAAGAAEPR